MPPSRAGLLRQFIEHYRSRHANVQRFRAPPHRDRHRARRRSLQFVSHAHSFVPHDQREAGPGLVRRNRLAVHGRHAQWNSSLLERGDRVEPCRLNHRNAKNAIPAEARTVLAAQGSAVPSSAMTPSRPKATEARTRVPVLPGSWTPSNTSSRAPASTSASEARGSLQTSKIPCGRSVSANSLSSAWSMTWSSRAVAANRVASAEPPLVCWSLGEVTAKRPSAPASSASRTARTPSTSTSPSFLLVLLTRSRATRRARRWLKPTSGTSFLCTPSSLPPTTGSKDARRSASAGCNDHCGQR